MVLGFFSDVNRVAPLASYVVGFVCQGIWGAGGIPSVILSINKIWLYGSLFTAFLAVGMLLDLHHRDRLSDKPDFAHRQGVIHRDMHARTGGAAGNGANFVEQILARQHRHHAGMLFRRRHVETVDFGMRILTAEKGGMQGAHHGHIVHILAITLNQCRIFAPLDFFANQFWQNRHD
jgi:hypothetical protein